MALGIEGEWVRARHSLEQGDQIYCSLVMGRGAGRAAQYVTRRMHGWPRPAKYWRGWLGRAQDSRPPLPRSDPALGAGDQGPHLHAHRGDSRGAHHVATRDPRGERNWDYRYTWMRDSTFTLQALHYLNLDWEADEFMQFVADLEANDDGGLQIMYGIDGRRDLTESTRDDLFGLCGREPGAGGQRRLRPAPERRLRRGAGLDPAPHTALGSPAAAAVADRPVPGRVRDQGLEEARPGHLGGSRQAPALRVIEADVLGGARPGVQAGRDPPANPKLEAEWGSTAEEIKADILDHGVKDGILRQHYDTDALDASTLLAAIFGFLPGDDDRLRKSVDAIADDLTEDGFVLRYRTGETDDGLSGKEGSFLICSFWLVSALAVVGEQQRARDLMEKLLSVASPLGLFAEEFDADTGRHLGNFPQAFSHLALIEAAGRIILAERLHELGVVSDSYDVIVIGSGAGGGSSVHRLAPSGKRILLLERGDWLPREPQNWLAEDVFVENRYVSPETWYDADGKAFQPQVHYFVGGATKLYGAALYRLREKDFGELRHHDGVSPAWPIGYDELEPYYTQAEQLYQVHGARGEDPTEPPASAPYPFPAVSHEPRIQQLSDDLAAAGSPPLPRPLRDHARRGQHALQPLRAVQRLRRLPVPGPRQVRCRGGGGSAGARASQRHPAD